MKGKEESCGYAEALACISCKGQISQDAKYAGGLGPFCPTCYFVELRKLDTLLGVYGPRLGEVRSECRIDSGPARWMLTGVELVAARKDLLENQVRILTGVGLVGTWCLRATRLSPRAKDGTVHPMDEHVTCTPEVWEGLIFEAERP